MKFILSLFFSILPFCDAEEAKKYFLEYFRSFEYCAKCELTDSDVKSEGEHTVKYTVKELFWGDPKKFSIDLNIRLSAITPEYRRSEFLIVGSIAKDAGINPNSRPAYSIYPISADSFRINTFQDPGGKSMKWDSILSLLKDEKARLQSSKQGTSSAR